MIFADRHPDHSLQTVLVFFKLRFARSTLVVSIAPPIAAATEKALGITKHVQNCFPRSETFCQ